ncbi:MAG: phosphate transport system substrate-binding protein [Sphingobacteriales bacterium]|jgi:phosphate transport system substrate-binding protein
MKLVQIVLLVAATFIVQACGGTAEEKKEAASKSITIKGSDTVLPLAQKTAEEFMKAYPEFSITVVGGGSGVGISAFKQGNTDIAMASRAIKLGEKVDLEESGKLFTEKIIAYDALAIVVHPENKIDNLTREQLEGIFTGKTKNWKEVGGDDMEILCYSRESSSGTHDFFKKAVNDKKEFGPEILLMPATGAIVQSVSQTKGAIGYIGFAYMNKNVKAIGVSYDQGVTFIEPSLENASTGLYPITRPLFYYFLNDSEEKVKPFIDFSLSEAGNTVVKEIGYLPVSSQAN